MLSRQPRNTEGRRALLCLAIAPSSAAARGLLVPTRLCSAARDVVPPHGRAPMPLSAGLKQRRYHASVSPHHYAPPITLRCACRLTVQRPYLFPRMFVRCAWWALVTSRTSGTSTCIITRMLRHAAYDAVGGSPSTGEGANCQRRANVAPRVLQLRYCRVHLSLNPLSGLPLRMTQHIDLNGDIALSCRNVHGLSTARALKN